MPDRQIRLDIRGKFVDLDDGTTEYRFYWMLQSTAPVRDLFPSPQSFPSRAEALADFQTVCDILGWTNDITTVPARLPR